MIYHWVQWICLDDSNVKRFAEDEFRIDQRKMYAHNGLSPHNAHRTSNNKYVICSIWIIFVVSCLEYTRILNEILKFVCSKHHVRLPFFIASTFSSFISFSFYFYFSSNLSIYFYSIKCKSFSFLHDGCSPWIQHIKRSLWNSLHALSYFEMIDCRSSHLCKDTTNTEWKRNDILTNCYVMWMTFTKYCLNPSKEMHFWKHSNTRHRRKITLKLMRIRTWIE